MGKSSEVSVSAPVHRLATTVQIKLLQDEESAKLSKDIYHISPDLGQEIKTFRQRIVDLSRHGNIVSKYSAFVAIDTEGKKVEGKAVERPCPVPTLSEEFMSGLQTDTSTFCSRNPNPVFYSRNVWNIVYDKMMSVIVLQQLNGEWEVSEQLLMLLGVPQEEFGQQKFSKVPSVVCTVIVLSWLKKEFSHRHEEWQMIETKALAWLASRNLPMSAEDIILQTTQSLWSK